MNTKSILFVGCVAAMVLCGSVAIAEARGGSGGGGGGGGGSRGGGGGGFHSGAASARTGPGFARAGSRFGNGNFQNSRNFHGNHHRFRHHDCDDDDFFFFGSPFFFGASFYPYGYGYGSYPYGGYPYGYPPYGYYPYGNGYGSYDQSGYLASEAGRRSVVVEIQRRLARAGYYHGRIDGVVGPKTRSAMRAYQRSHEVTAR